jgi:hypothetical protein
MLDKTNGSHNAPYRAPSEQTVGYMSELCPSIISVQHARINFEKQNKIVYENARTRGQPCSITPEWLELERNSDGDQRQYMQRTLPGML